MSLVFWFLYARIQAVLKVLMVLIFLFLGLYCFHSMEGLELLKSRMGLLYLSFSVLKLMGYQEFECFDCEKSNYRMKFIEMMLEFLYTKICFFNCLNINLMEIFLNKVGLLEILMTGLDELSSNKQSKLGTKNRDLRVFAEKQRNMALVLFLKTL